MQQHTRELRDRIRAGRRNRTKTSVDVKREVQFLHVCGFEVSFLGIRKESAETARPVSRDRGNEDVRGRPSSLT